MGPPRGNAGGSPCTADLSELTLAFLVVRLNSEGGTLDSNVINLASRRTNQTFLGVTVAIGFETATVYIGPLHTESQLFSSRYAAGTFLEDVKMRHDISGTMAEGVFPIALCNLAENAGCIGPDDHDKIRQTLRTAVEECLSRSRRRPQIFLVPQQPRHST